MWRAIIVLVAVGVLIGAGLTLRHWMPLPVQERLRLRADITEIRTRQVPRLTAALERAGAEFAAPVFIRIFKEEAELELFIWRNQRFVLFRTYPICNFSGDLGPKQREGDRQAPEGIYEVTSAALNPASRFHLSFNLGFPNAFDRAQDRTGSFLMVHGDCVSVGCYAMTDPAIEEIYVLVEAALRAGQPEVLVHAFPFRPTPARLARAKESEWHAFWTDLAVFYNGFEQSGTPSTFARTAGSGPEMRYVPGVTVVKLN